nr:MAG TPA: hypothetical protein [Bacteriophage sp.]
MSFFIANLKRYFFLYTFLYSERLCKEVENEKEN